ncbi:stage III sporulation protein AA [Gottschalkia acidurici 9a]|uniref:Stage III sporulation protein AA n=1 Tax=Gottschalkia acidurici (strain ATCC 7906 / DSM 604 / BCRC 14475 / CIP 104303 / KCTC 5404 / NCIMB 10678 / 9a) TaxID=1128398 RepID=K0B023_GOTA9|nr:stage III sporulation protein AA [Gottschalkia acidurici]AFS78382.1 stage III sporulation protein AA [Gottschalkia acidurici 9a]
MKQSIEFHNILQYIDQNLKEILINIDKNIAKNIEEIRLRMGKPLMIYSNGVNYYIDKKGTLYSTPINLQKSYLVTPENIYKTFQIVSNYSVYSIQEELKQGFITIKGGHRIGLVGRGVYNRDKLENIKDISSINIRIAREVMGASNHIIKYVIKNSHSIYNTLIISPPKCGKTTILRDLIRNISNGINSYNFEGLKVGVVDERSELAGTYNGQPQNDLGYRTDILDGCYKHDGIMILLRAMSPDVIATDELGHPNDIKAIYEAMKGGVQIISTVHGANLDDVKNKPNIKDIVEEKVFKRIVVLDNSKGVGTISDIIDGETFKSITH